MRNKLKYFLEEIFVMNVFAGQVLTGVYIVFCCLNSQKSEKKKVK